MWVWVADQSCTSHPLATPRPRSCNSGGTLGQVVRLLARLDAAVGTAWYQLAPIGADWRRRVQMGADGCRWVQMGADGCRWVQMGADGCRWVQMGADGCRLVHVDVCWRGRWEDAHDGTARRACQRGEVADCYCSATAVTAVDGWEAGGEQGGEEGGEDGEEVGGRLASGGSRHGGARRWWVSTVS